MIGFIIEHNKILIIIDMSDLVVVVIVVQGNIRWQYTTTINTTMGTGDHRIRILLASLLGGNINIIQHDQMHPHN